MPERAGGLGVTRFGPHGLKRASRAALLALGCVALAGCHAPRAQSDLGVRLTLAPNPPRVGQADLTLHLSERGQVLNNAEVRVEGNMTHPGMYPVRAAAKFVGEGKYQVPNFTLSMAGDWIVTVQAKTGGRVLSADVPLEVGEP